jgi:YidC/Oxa1 family membrane protein insertase
VGILNPLYDAVSWIIVQFHSLYSHVFPADSGWAWGLSIASLVILIRICLIPLFVKQIKSTRNMQAIQPRMKAIQERYKNDRQRQSEEMMKLYKETGTNPLSSCLPILVQSPFFFALYHVLSNVAKGHKVGFIHQDLVDSAKHASIFGAPLPAKFLDSAATAHKLGASLTDIRVVTIVMIVLMSASQFYTQRQLMTKNVDMTVKTPFMQQQKMLMYVFPIMFAVFGIRFPVGVLVYWLTTNVWTMGQQMFVIRRNPTPGSLAFKQRQERLRAKGKLKDETPGQDKEPVAAGPVKRTQPKRQTKAQRQTGGAGSATGAGKPGAAAEKDTAAEDTAAASGASDAGSGSAPASAGKGSANGSSGRSGVTKPTGGVRKPTGGAPGRSSGARKSSGTGSGQGKSTGSAGSKPNLSKKK